MTEELQEIVKEEKVIIEEEKEPEFENYKQKQNYYKEKYSNRGTIFFAQQPKARMYTEDGMIGHIKSQKGRTYKKFIEE